MEIRRYRRSAFGQERTFDTETPVYRVEADGYELPRPIPLWLQSLISYPPPYYRYEDYCQRSYLFLIGRVPAPPCSDFPSELDLFMLAPFSQEILRD